MIEITVYTSPDYSTNISLWVRGDMTRDEITDYVNAKIDKWYYYDIMG